YLDAPRLSTYDRPMKTLLLVTLALALSFSAYSEEDTQTGKAPAALAKMLAGKTLKCGGVNANDVKGEDDGFIPISMQAKQERSGIVKITVTAADPKVYFGYGGSSFYPVERTSNWTILTVGDDGARTLMLQNFSISSNDSYACNPKQMKNGFVDGDIAGVL